MIMAGRDMEAATQGLTYEALEKSYDRLQQENQRLREKLETQGVSKELAELFFQQCCGSYSGHMAMIPNNPVLHSIFIACGINAEHDRDSRAKFAAKLRQIADAIV